MLPSGHHQWQFQANIEMTCLRIKPFAKSPRDEAIMGRAVGVGTYSREWKAISLAGNGTLLLKIIDLSAWARNGIAAS